MVREWNLHSIYNYTGLPVLGARIGAVNNFRINILGASLAYQGVYSAYLGQGGIQISISCHPEIKDIIWPKTAWFIILDFDQTNAICLKAVINKVFFL